MVHRAKYNIVEKYIICPIWRVKPKYNLSIIVYMLWYLISKRHLFSNDFTTIKWILHRVLWLQRARSITTTWWLINFYLPMKEKRHKPKHNLYTFPAIYFAYGTILIHTARFAFWWPVIAGHKFIFTISNAGLWSVRSASILIQSFSNKYRVRTQPFLC